MADAVSAASANGSAVAASTQAAAPVPELSETESAELRELLHALQAVRVGDFSVRMAGNQVGIIGKIADTFNEIVAANAAHGPAARARRRGRRPAGQDPPARAVRPVGSGAWGEMEARSTR